MQVLGMVGVNLIHACFTYTEPEAIINALRDNIHPSRIEIDMFRIEGPDFHHVDNRLMALKLVKNGLENMTACSIMQTSAHGKKTMIAMKIF